jgi:hypothetical protein
MKDDGKVIFMEDVQKTYAMVMGGVLVLIGILGFFMNPLLGLFGVNALQNIVHLLGGALGLWLGNSGSGKAFNMWLGIVGAVLAVLGFIPATAALLASWLGVNIAITVLHAAIGLVSLGVAYGVKAQ